MGGPQVLPGRIVEQPNLLEGGVERRAFGEFVGPRGELASYAFGWTTGDAEAIGRVTVGIGAGHPGGGSFHATVFASGESYAMSLVDDPFEQVPEGGRDLDRDEGLAHPDLPFIWFVADEVMEHDPRAWQMRHWLLGTLAIATPPVLERFEPVLHLQHDADGMWQTIGSTDAGAEGGIVHLWHLVEDDPTLVPVLHLAVGDVARRSSRTSAWQREGPDHGRRRRFGRRKG